jgi:hypothetical protein
MNKFLFSLACASTIFIASCSKSDTSPSTNFQPVTAGSFWKYQTLTGTNTLTATSRDTTISGKVYRVFTNSTGNTSSYYNHTGADYFQYGSVAGGVTAPVDLLYLKDNVAVGGSWEVPISVTPPGSTTPTNGKIVFTIGVKDSSMTVLGKSYTAVTRVKIDVIVTVALFGDRSVGGGNSYFSNNVGNISSSITVTNPLTSQSVNSKQDLMDYVIQ